MEIDHRLDWSPHIDKIKTKISKSFYGINRAKQHLSTNHKLTLYYALIYPYIRYGILLWGATFDSYKKVITTLQKKIIRMIAGAKYNDHTEPLFRQLKVLKFEDLYTFEINRFMFTFIREELPMPLANMFNLNRNIHRYETRQRNDPHFTRRRTQKAARSLVHVGPEKWSKLTDDIKHSTTMIEFKRKMKRKLLENYTTNS